MSLNRLIRYFTKRKLLPNVPQQLISPYILKNSNEDELLIMMSGRARSPEAARRLMNKYGATTAAALLEKLPPRRRNVFKRRLVALIRRMEGHYKGKAFQRPKERSEVFVQYKFRRGK